MKRKERTRLDMLEQTQQGGRRQPQISCANCRVKKIKCDRGAPCHSCAIRGLSCPKQPGPEPPGPRYNLADPSTDPSILSRLDSLERAVFGGGDNSTSSSKIRFKSSAAASKQAANNNSPLPSSYQNTERQQAAKLLDSTYTRDHHSIATQPNRPRFHVASASSHSKQAPGSCPTGRPAFLMTREEALLLLHDFCENPFHLLPIIYEPSARSLINTFYTQLEQGNEGCPTAAALILSIASTSASFFNNNAKQSGVFSSTEVATETSLIWTQTALNILEDSQFSADVSLEGCQARAILAYVVSNVEGCSARYRFLHSCSVAIARDMSLHLTDSTVTAGGSDDLPTKEIKRRLWWHLASTDWLLGLVGGPLDGTYTVQPRHFIVKRPRNLNDNDLSQSDETFTYPLNVPTQISCFLQRIRLSEICREMIDSRTPGLLDVEITDISKVTSLDLLFETALLEMPPLTAQEAPPQFAQQRDLILLCYHTRRARLHRPFLLHDTDNPRYERSRRQCVSSARSVLSISIGMLEKSSAVDQGQAFENPLAYRAGVVISGTFMACTILALNEGLIGNRSTDDAGTCEPASGTHAEITRACRALAKAGETSSFAANLLRNLVRVLKQYRVKEIDDLVKPTAVPTNSDIATEGNVGDDDAFTARDQSHWIGDPLDIVDNFTMWNEFFATMPEMDGYDQLFADLDYCCGPT
ncbi:hypothetical protein GGS21DRAFT_523452 [Xylaria nigripes]|nr:hypothetical protein GGS21DRAFT_523452 [Xylaria nigripes]